jgi:hypothetical protein
MRIFGAAVSAIERGRNRRLAATQYAYFAYPIA